MIEDEKMVPGLEDDTTETEGAEDDVLGTDDDEE